MNLSEPFIRRPVATTLLTIGIALAGALAYFQPAGLAAAAGGLPDHRGARRPWPARARTSWRPPSPRPLERHLGQIADVTEMTSSSSTGSSHVTLQFGLNRDIDGAARDVEAAINAARADLPTALRSNPTYRKVNPADAPIMILTLTSATLHRRADLRRRRHDPAAEALAGEAASARCRSAAARCRRCASSSIPSALFKYGIGLEDVRAALASANANTPEGLDRRRRGSATRSTPTTRPAQAAEYRAADRRLPQRRRGAPGRTSPTCQDSVEDVRNLGLANGKPAVLVILYRQPGANIIDDGRSGQGAAAGAAGLDPDRHRPEGRDRSHHDHPRLAARRRAHAADRHLAGGAGGVPVPAQRPRHAGAGVAVPDLAHRHLRRHVPARLQPRQPVADGADHRHRLRGRRRHRRAGEHHAPHRGRHAALRGGAARRARGRLHGAVDEPVAGRGVHARSC